MKPRIEKVEVIWFNKNKGYGEGKTTKGIKVTLFKAAIPPKSKISLKPGKVVTVEIKKETIPFDSSYFYSYAISK